MMEYWSGGVEGLGRPVDLKISILTSAVSLQDGGACRAEVSERRRAGGSSFKVSQFRDAFSGNM